MKTIVMKEKEISEFKIVLSLGRTNRISIWLIELIFISFIKLINIYISIINQFKNESIYLNQTFRSSSNIPCSSSVVQIN